MGQHAMENDEQYDGTDVEIETQLVVLLWNRLKKRDFNSRSRILHYLVSISDQVWDMEESDA